MLCGSSSCTDTAFIKQNNAQAHMSKTTFEVQYKQKLPHDLTEKHSGDSLRMAMLSFLLLLFQF